MTLPYSFVNSGVPHVVVVTPDLDACEVVRLGRAIRHHPDFAPAGTNANFMAVSGPSALRLRTYERGVEDETLACGTGVVASALIAERLRLVKPPVAVRVASGDVLQVGMQLTAEGASQVTLEGPAVHVFQGELEYPSR